MIERALYDVIEAGIAYLSATPGAVTNHLVHHGFMAEDEAANIERLFQTTHAPTLAHGFARGDSKFPLLTIVMGSEDQSQSFVGDDGGVNVLGMDEGDPEYGADLYAAIYSYQFHVIIYTQNIDLTLAYYQLVRQMIINGLPTLRAEPYNVDNVRLSGADVAPDRELAPMGFFVRRLTLSCQREYTQPIASSTVGRAYKVAGVHTDSGGAPGEDVGGVKTLVTVQAEVGDDGEG